MATRPEGVTGVPMHVGGMPISGGDWMEVVDPYTSRSWARVPLASAAHVDAAVGAARRAFNGPWGALTPKDRADALRRYASVIASHADELSRLQVMENGKAIREQSAQTAGLAGYLTYFAGLAESLRGETIPVSTPRSFCYTVHEPLGVVAAVTPWNSPLALLMWKLAPALAAGNTIVVKPSEVSPVSTLRLAELATEAGLPPGVVNVVTGDGGVGAVLAGHPGIDKVAFTGSTAAGKAVATAAIQNLSRFTLELGGKSANIVFADADLPRALEGVVGGIFAAAGQTCVAGSRVLLQDSIYDEFAERLVERTCRIRLGDPLDFDTEVGTMACRRQFDKVTEYLGVAHEDGAKLLTPGQAATGIDGDALFIRPTIFGEVRNDMRIAREEVFGPVACLIRFADAEDAVAIANDSPFGLAAGVWTRDVATAFEVSARLRSGTVWINTYRRLSYAVPFGGFRQSGIGRESGVEAMKEYTELKSVWLETGPGLSDPFNPLG